jgi:hypothetical protein
MAEEVKITPDAEVNAPKEGTVEAEIVKVEPETKKPETVPLAVYLELKEDLKTLKHEIKESQGKSKETVAVEGYDSLKAKYPDVSPEFIQDMLGAATIEATKKIESKYSPIIEKQENEKKQEAFDRAFDSLFEKTLKENPDLPQTIDKDTIKTLATTEKYRNVPLAEILLKMYPVQNVGRPSSENDARTSGDKVEDIVSFEKITPEQKSAILDDPKARAKYFSWLDTQTGR